MPAFEHGMDDQLREVAAIADNPEPATFANTVEALERSGQILKRTSIVFFSVASSDATDGIRAIETEISPRLAKHRDAIHLNRALYARIKQIATESPEEAWLLEKYRVDFVRAGAELSEEEQERLKALNEELSTLSTTFSQNLLAASTASALVTEDRTELDGLPESTLQSIHQDGKYVLPLLNFTNQPALAELTSRETRRKLYELSVNRAPENFELAIKMATLRAERAALLGYPNHAAYSVADQTAKTTGAVEEMLAKLAGPAVANARREAEALSEQAGFAIEPWDWSFYAEKVRKARYDFDSSELRPYFELDRVLRDGVFHAATELYGVTFADRTDLIGYHPDVRVYEVFDADGSPMGLFLFDPYARPTKRGGAWMNNLVDQSHLFGELPVVMNNLNITKPAEGPTLLTFDEVNTAFHEFGHALHGLFSDVRFPGSPAPRCRATSSSTPRRSTRCGRPGRRSWPTSPGTTRPASRSPPSSWRRCGPPRSSTRASRPWSTSPRRCSTGPGTSWPPARPWRTPRRSRRRPWSGRGSPSRWSAPATGPTTSRTSSRWAWAATARATTPTSGARSWTPTASSGSRRTAA
nr:hypothetical protein GCM10020093_055840 [Planobispora longispora]